MRRWFGACLAAALALLPAAAPAAETSPLRPGASAEAPTGESARTDGASSFVQQGLTIHELDKELVRLKAEEADVAASIDSQQTAIERQRAALDVRSEAAGRVLRAYYTGQRDNLWMLLLRSRSFSEALLVIDYLQAIVRSDIRTLELHQASFREQQSLLAELTNRQERLRSVIGEHERQRGRLVEAQAALDRRLAELNERERQERLAEIAAATADWEEEGNGLFEEVLTSLSRAMAELPDLISGDPSLLKVEGSQMEIRLTDEALNDFLRERDRIFETFRFSFGADGLTVSGTLEGNAATLRGNYFIEAEPEHALRFELESVNYNGYELPDTTRAAMQKMYDLSFKPGLLIAGLEVTDLFNEEGLLRVTLRFSFASSGFRF